MSATMSLVDDRGPTIDVLPGEEASLLGELIRDFETSEEASNDAREWAERCRDYYDGKQLTPEEMSAMKARRQPPVINNKIAEKIDLLCGMERRGRSDPKAFPRTPMEDDRADVATQCLRYIADDNRFDVIRSSVYKNMLIEGCGGCEVIAEERPQSRASLMASVFPAPPEYDVIINYIAWDRFFWDPHSQHPGFADARYIGLVIWMDRDEALDRYPGTEDIIGTTLDASSLSSTYGDKPSTQWGDRVRRRVRVVQIWFKRGRDWWTATFTKGGFLEYPSKSPYLDRHDNGACPLIFRSGYVDRQNNRYGVVSRMLSMQDAINKRESKLLWSVSVNRVIMEEGAVADEDAARREAARPDGLIKVNPNMRFEIGKDQAEIAGQFQLLQYAVQQMNTLGPNASMAGKDPREQSGRAILAQQAGGMVQAEPLADELRQWTHKVWEAAWLRVRQFWTAPKMIRVTDNDKNVRFVGINRPVTLQEELKNMPPEQAAMLVQRLGILGPDDPRLRQIVRMENDLDDLDVDIMVEEGPDTPNMQYEQFDALMKLPPQILAQFPPAVIIKMSQLRDKDDLLKILEQAQQAAAPAKQKAEATQMAMAEAAVADKQAQAKEREANAVVKVHNVAMDHAEMTQPTTTVTMERPPLGGRSVGQPYP